MLGIIFKSTLAFLFSFIVLSIPIASKPIFYHISELTGPLGSDIKKSFSKSIKRSVKKTKSLGSDLFTNTTPPNLQAQGSSKQNKILSNRRNRIRKSGRTSEELRHAEKKALDSLISK